MRTYYAAVDAKDADKAVDALQALESSKVQSGDQELEIRQVIPMGQKALVIYVCYERGVVR